MDFNDFNAPDLREEFQENAADQQGQTPLVKLRSSQQQQQQYGSADDQRIKELQQQQQQPQL